MNTATAINVFARAVVRERRIPFAIASSDVTRDGAMQVFKELRREAKESGATDMTLDEINREIDFALSI